jgi:hypothetical protein
MDLSVRGHSVSVFVNLGLNDSAWLTKHARSRPSSIVAHGCALTVLFRTRKGRILLRQWLSFVLDTPSIFFSGLSLHFPTTESFTFGLSLYFCLSALIHKSYPSNDAFKSSLTVRTLHHLLQKLTVLYG